MTLPLKNTIRSVMAAFIGVQSDKNRDEDFQEGKLSHFVVVAILILSMFLGMLLTIVDIVLT